MSLLIKKFREYKLSQEIIDVYRDRLDDESITGIIADFSSEFMLLNCLTEKGENAGISVFYIEDITRIRAKGNIRQSLKDLSQRNKTRFKSYKINLTSIDTVLSSVQESFGYVSLSTEEILQDQECFIGSIKHEDKDWIALNSFGTMSNRDIKQLILKKDDITCVDAGGKYEDSINYLASLKKQD